ncbi:MAG: hypothetical protein BroJett011_26400 [Chloroflexota bacterium]|nr:MAG: hypothetical protein BroJett011_26400 [Chloroflexota bacterium]
MLAADQTTLDVAARRKQLVELTKNLNILQERQAKYGGNAPLELLHQIQDHYDAISLLEQALAGQLSEAELEEALKPLLLALRDGQVVNITAETYVAGDQVIQNISHIVERALTAAEAAETARSIVAQRLAQGVSDYARRLQAVATNTADTAGSNPYKGLQSYTLSDAELFYGRDQAIADLLQQLQRGRLTILHSESGAGKSSLLQAGIANRLIGQGHLPVYLRPYNQSPTLVIKRVFLPNLAENPELVQLPLRDFLRQVTEVLGQQSTLYLLLDQFEEVFTQLDEDLRHAFVAELAGCLEDESLNVRWVLALRTEFFGNLANFRPRIRNPFENDYRLNRLNFLEAKTVITGPAARQGITFEPDLVGALLTDLHEEQSDEISPPQIQLVCSALYNTLQERRAENPGVPATITQQMYEEEGRAQGILRGHLNRVLHRTLNPTERKIARHLLMALVSSDQRRIRRAKSDLAATLATYLVGAQDLDSLLDQLVETRLLNVVEEDESTSQLAYELAHDYLLTEIRLDPETQARKAAEELLKQEVATFKQHGTLLSDDKFNIIRSQRRFLRLEDDAAKLLHLSEAAYRRAQLRRYGLIAATVLVIIGAAIAIAIIQSRSAAQQAISAATAVAGATQASRAEATAQAEAVRAQNAENAAQVEALNAVRAQAEAQVQAIKATQAEATAQAEKIIAETNAAEAQRQTNLANARQLTSQAQSVLDKSPEQALLLLFEAQGMTQTLEAKRVIGQVPYRYFPLQATLENHTGPVFAVAWSPDGRQLASASADQTVTIWGKDTGQFTTLRGHTGSAFSVAWSPDGKQLASGSFDKTVIIWDVATGQPTSILHGHEDIVYRVAWSPDGKQLASSSPDQTIIIWDVATGKRAATLRGHTGEVQGVAWSPDGKQLASGSGDQTIIIWNVTTGRRTRTLHGHTSWVYGVAWSPDGKRLASTSVDQTVIIWDVATGQPIFTLRGHSDWVNNVAWSPDGLKLASASADQTVILWDTTTGQLITTLYGHTGEVQDVAWSLDGRWLASASSDQTVIIWDMANGPAGATLRGHTNSINSVAWSPEGNRLASASADLTIIIWDRTTGQTTSLRGHPDVVNDVAWSPDGRQVASASSDETVIIWDVEEGQPSATLPGHTDIVRQVAWSPDGKQLASASLDQTLMIWDVTTGQPAATLRGHEGEVLGVAWSPDGKQLASASTDQTVMIWDVATGQATATFRGHKGEVFGVAWSPDGKQLASASLDQTVMIWDVATGQPAATLHGHTDWVHSVAWSPDGKQLASASDDQTVIVWDVAKAEPIATLHGHTDWVFDVAWSPDGQELASASQDQTIQLLNTRFMQPSCQWVTRNLGAAEWAAYLPASLPYHRTCPNLPVPASVIEAARDLARNGQVDEAIAQFNHLLTLDPTLELDPEAEAQQALQEGVQSLLDTAKEQARAGDVESATSTFQQALDLDPSLKLDPQAEAQRLAEPTFENVLTAAVDAANQADEETAPAKFEEAINLAAALNSAEAWHTLCDTGTRHGFAEAVLEACDKAIELEPENGLYYNSRGIARLQGRDQKGAQEDFARFEAWLAERQPGP